MDFRPKQLLAMAALACGLAFGGATLASAQTSDDTGTTNTTVPTDDGTTSDTGRPEDCPHDGAGPAAGSGTTDSGADVSASSTSA